MGLEPCADAHLEGEEGVVRVVTLVERRRRAGLLAEVLSARVLPPRGLSCPGLLDQRVAGAEDLGDPALRVRVVEAVVLEPLAVVCLDASQWNECADEARDG